MLIDDDTIFNELEEIINTKKLRYQRALEMEEDSGRILTRVTQLEDSLIDAYIKYTKLKYSVREHKIGLTDDIMKDFEDFEALEE